MRDWWRDGLPGALSIRAFGVASPLVLVVAAVLVGGSNNASWLAWFFFASAAFFAAIIVAQVTRLWMADGPASMRRWVALVLLLLTGPITMLGAVAIASIAGVVYESQVDVELVLLSTFLAAWLLAGGRLSSTLADDARYREELLREIAREKALALESARLVEVDRQRLVEDIRGMVTERLVATHGDGGNPDYAAAHLRFLVNDAVRPLSHELHDAQVREEELVDQVAMMRIPRAPALWAKPQLITRAEAGDTLLALAFIGAGVVAGFTAISLEAGQLWALFPVVYSLGLAVVLLLANARARNTRAEVTGAFQAADRASALVRQAAWVTRRRLANTMHGEVQGRILASALRLPGMSNREERDELMELTSDLHRMLSSDLGDGDWRVAWDRLTEMWMYAIDLDVEGQDQIDEHLVHDPVAGSALVAVVGEAVTNAVRHGRAKHVHVSMTPRDDDAFLVVVTDDGTESGAAGVPSLGSSTLGAVTLDWGLEHVANGHQLRAVIPIRGRRPTDVSRENSEHVVVAGL